MPRQPKQSHPLRQLRKVLGETQAQLAKHLGITTSFLQKIELGQRSIQKELKEDLINQFGIHPESLESGSDEIRTLLGTPLTLNFIKLWREQVLSEKDHRIIENQLVLQLRAILAGSRELNHASQRLVASKISALFLEIRNSPTLSRHIDSYFESISTQTTPTSISVRELKSKYTRFPGLKKRLTGYHDDEVATISERRIPRWVPQQGACVVSMEDGSRNNAFVVCGTADRLDVTVKLRKKRFPLRTTESTTTMIMPPSE